MLPGRRGASSRLRGRLSHKRVHTEDWEAIGRVHGEFFGDIRPAATMVVVAALLNPNWRIEMEFDAVIPEAAATGNTASDH